MSAPIDPSKPSHITGLDSNQRVKARDIAFGKEEWKRFYGADFKEPPLPKKYEGVDLDDWLNSPDPKCPGKMRHETHRINLAPFANGTAMWVINRIEP